jgi:predicted nuclease of predicted toxin-antitoxin system
MAQLYADENVPLPVVQALRQLGCDVLTAQEAGNAGHAVPDEGVLAYARTYERVLLTLNRKHFIRLHARHP